MKYLFYAIVFDVAGNTTAVGSSTSPAKSITTNIQKVTGISINPNLAQTKNIGETFKITATVSPNDANNKGINWSSSSSGIATVDSSGNVRCLSVGTTTITATAADSSGVKAQLSLTVRNPINSLSLDKDQTTILKDGYTSTVTATTDPANYDGANISWTIADTSIAAVTVSGKTATIKSTSKVGQTTLTVSAGGITKTVNVSVVNFTTQTYSYTGTVQQVDLPAGTYKLEVWGAQGGDSGRTDNKGKAGLGGYSIGTICLTSSVIAYVYVGGQGSAFTADIGTAPGGWNGGGTVSDLKNNAVEFSASGGGASDIRILKDSLYSRVIVAGGGGGGGQDLSYGYNGGAGGGLNGIAGSGASSSDRKTTGGTQTSKGKDGNTDNNGSYTLQPWGTASSEKSDFGGSGGRWRLVRWRDNMC